MGQFDHSSWYLLGPPDQQLFLTFACFDHGSTASANERQPASLLALGDSVCPLWCCRSAHAGTQSAHSGTSVHSGVVGLPTLGPSLPTLVPRPIHSGSSVRSLWEFSLPLLGAWSASLGHSVCRLWKHNPLTLRLNLPTLRLSLPTLGAQSANSRNEFANSGSAVCPL